MISLTHPHGPRWNAGMAIRYADQNSRFLVLPATGRWPDLASRVLKLVCARLPQDWQAQFGHPVLLVGTFVGPKRI